MAGVGYATVMMHIFEILRVLGALEVERLANLQGSMTSWTPRDLSLDLSFLGTGTYEMILYQDGINADRTGSDFRMTQRTVTKADTLVLKLAPGGGWAAVISPR